jgi:hypothetical protein
MTTTTARRKYRSSRNFPPATDSCRFLFVAARDAGVARNLLPAADALEALLLEKAQEFHLDRRWQLTDLVEEERASRRSFDGPVRCAWAPRNAPFSWPKSSLSSGFSGIELQLMATNGPVATCGCSVIQRNTDPLAVLPR